MSDEQKQSQQNDDEVLVKQADGTFKTMKVALGGATEEVKSAAVTVAIPTVLPEPQRPTPQQSPTPIAVSKDVDRTGGAWLSAEEEQDVKHEPTMQQAKKQQDRSLDRAVDALVAAAGIQTLDVALLQRFRNAVSLRLRGIRDDLETKDVLSKTKENGGLGMDEVSAGRVLELARAMSFVELASSPTLPMSVQAPPATAQTVRPGEVVSMPTARADHVEAAQPPVRIPQPPVARMPQTPPVQRAQPTVSRDAVRVVQQPVVQTTAPHLRGPVDELRFTLAEWKRLGGTTKERTDKVAMKIQVLEGESYAKRLEGMRAWQESDVMRLYCDIIVDSLTKGRSIADILGEREKNKLPSMTMESFVQIAEVNVILRV